MSKILTLLVVISATIPQKDDLEKIRESHREMMRSQAIKTLEWKVKRTQIKAEGAKREKMRRENANH